MMRAFWVGLFGLCVAACGGSSSNSGGNPDGGGAGGTGGTGSGGSGGGGGAPAATDKLDVLFMIDNSISMADKQQLLAEAVPRLIQQLVTPPVDPGTGKPIAKPVTDLHIGVITSSLGGHGGDQCSSGNPAFNPTQDDHGHLVPTVRGALGLNSYSGLGFLWWDPNSKATPPGETDNAKLAADFAAHVTAAGESGCGYEAQLESWYRFLVDPQPPLEVVMVDQYAQKQGVDQALLQQRHDFLRPDSAVVVLMLTDENDCSTKDGSYNWIASQTSNPNNTAFHLPRATIECESNPNDPCCRSCGLAVDVAGCAPIQDDPECAKGVYDDFADHPNVRCHEQKRRFGLDFTYPTRKYVEALSQPTICTDWIATTANPTPCMTAGERVPNPLLETRDPRLVFLVGVVGVPWQDLATDATLTDPNELEYLSSAELAAKGRWDWLVRKCKKTVSAPLPRPMEICEEWDLTDQPDDPLMIESLSPRTGVNPATGTAIADPSSGALANPINGHEWLTADADLQYACISPLATPKDCSAAFLGCDCDDVDTGYSANNPLCQSNADGYTKMQLFAKAFPATRELEVLKDLGDQSVVASICAKSIANAGTSAYGYNAAMTALVRRLSTVLPK